MPNIKNNNKAIYEAPKAVSLSAIAQGACVPGSSVVGQCEYGASASPLKCEGGGTAGGSVGCKPGTLATPRCVAGTSASGGGVCNTGGGIN